jgi:lipoate-protein ligase A
MTQASTTSSTASSTTSSTTWPLIVDPALSGEVNMRIDERLLREVEASEVSQTILRFYSWARPTVSLGRSQKVEKAVDLDFCRDQGIDVVHRPTGGRAVLHDNELTYAVVSNEPERFDGGSVYGTYRRISEALLEGYLRLGVEAELARDTVRHRRSDGDRDDPCFLSPSRYELMFKGRKIVGSAQRRLRRGFLQHGSMLISCDRALLARATRMVDSSVLEDEMAGLTECLNEPPARDAMIAAFTSGFADSFDVEFTLDRRVPAHNPPDRR